MQRIAAMMESQELERARGKDFDLNVSVAKLLILPFVVNVTRVGSASSDCACVSEPDDFDVAQEITVDPESNSVGDEASHWDAIITEHFKAYLSKGCYPADLPSSGKGKRRIFRKRAKDFVVQDDQLFYRDKRDKSLRLAIYSGTSI